MLHNIFFSAIDHYCKELASALKYRLDKDNRDSNALLCGSFCATFDAKEYYND